MKTITIDIADVASVRRAEAELRAIRADWLKRLDRAANAVAEELALLIADNYGDIGYSDDIKDISTHASTPRIPMYAVYARNNVVYVQDQEVAFVEFGAGIYHNAGGTVNPLSSVVSFDTSIGSYGKGQGNNKYWFIAHNLISCGTPAYMPIAKAIEAIKLMAPTIVRRFMV